MKKILLIATLLCTALVTNAEKITRTDDFTDAESKFGFDPNGDKKHTVALDGEFLVITSKKGDYLAGTRFPVNTRQNFKISYKLLFPTLDNKHLFGLVFNYDEDANTGDILYITENTFYIKDSEGTKLGKAEKIKLKKGKNVSVTVDVEKKGKKLFLSINGVDFQNEDLEIRTSYMGFYVNEKNTLKVDQIKITQNVEE